jgi:hypothetical protein
VFLFSQGYPQYPQVRSNLWITLWITFFGNFKQVIEKSTRNAKNGVVDNLVDKEKRKKVPPKKKKESTKERKRSHP